MYLVISRSAVLLCKVFCIFRYSAATTKKCLWAIHIFEQWKRLWEFKVPTVLSLNMITIDGHIVDKSDEVLCIALCHFIFEMNRSNQVKTIFRKLYMKYLFEFYCFSQWKVSISSFYSIAIA